MNAAHGENPYHERPAVAEMSRAMSGEVSFGNSKGGVIDLERAPCSDGQNMDPEDQRQVSEGVRQGDAPAAAPERQPQPGQPPPLT
jgi:hypothetical protein